LKGTSKTNLALSVNAGRVLLFKNTKHMKYNGAALIFQLLEKKGDHDVAGYRAVPTALV
jgi:hypothetical protein